MFFRYLIFFDNGWAQYRQHRDIRLTAYQNSVTSVYNTVHYSSKEFIKSYLESYPDQKIMKLTSKKIMTMKRTYNIGIYVK